MRFWDLTEPNVFLAGSTKIPWLSNCVSSSRHSVAFNRPLALVQLSNSHIVCASSVQLIPAQVATTS
jgi:hypothetical protein